MKSKKLILPAGLSRFYLPLSLDNQNLNIKINLVQSMM